MDIKDCFVIMPFSSSTTQTEEGWTEIFENFFVPAWNEFGVNCTRAQAPRGSITKDIIEKLYSASIVFADLTDSNPNVMYELGVRHTFKKPSVMVKTKASSIPFDVNDYKVFEYSYTPKGLKDLKKHLNEVIGDIQKFPNKADNPVWDFRNTSDFLVDYIRNIETINKLQAIVLELNSNITLCDKFMTNTEPIDLLKDDVELSYEQEEQLNLGTRELFPNIRSDAITHLRVNRYIDFEKQEWELLEQIDDFYRWAHYYSSNLERLDFSDKDRTKIANTKGLMIEAMKLIGTRIARMKKEDSLSATQ